VPQPLDAILILTPPPLTHDSLTSFSRRALVVACRYGRAWDCILRASDAAADVDTNACLLPHLLTIDFWLAKFVVHSRTAASRTAHERASHTDRLLIRLDRLWLALVSPLFRDDIPRALAALSIAQRTYARHEAAWSAREHLWMRGFEHMMKNELQPAVDAFNEVG
jgi:hypothetical protein